MPYAVDHVHHAMRPARGVSAGPVRPRSALNDGIQLERPSRLDHDDFPFEARVFVPFATGLDARTVWEAVVDALRIVADQTGFERTSQRFAAVDQRDLVVVGV